jgi:hypothetical protein
VSQVPASRNVHQRPHDLGLAFGVAPGGIDPEPVGEVPIAAILLG